MDTKALAKSKRAHSLHHSKKNHTHQPAKSALTNSSNVPKGSKNPTGKQIKVKVQPFHGSKPLPSNWDRYGEEEGLNLGSEDTNQETASQPSEFVVPKSKGSDYAFLLSEATAQSRTDCSSEGFRLFDDGFEDFTHDFGTLLSAKGQSMLSWITDDSFKIEDQTNTGHEAAFLSLDLNQLADQLVRAKPSERLFLEPDLLPPELLDDDFQPCDEEHDQLETCSSAVAVNYGALSLSQHHKGYKNTVEDHEPVSHNNTTAIEVPVLPSREGLKQPMEESLDEILDLHETVSIFPNSTAMHNRDSATRSTFEAANAETDLDMLLNSFNETKFLESSSISSSGIPAATKIASVRNGAQAPASFGDTIDNLLQETSGLIKIDSGMPAGVKTSFVIPPTSNPSSKSKLLDDFDSWLDSI